MGGALAADAHAAGHEVHLLDVNEALVAAIQRDGIAVTTGGERQVARVRASTDPVQIGICDVVIVFVKAQHTRTAAGSIPALRGDETVVASLQNGWGNTDVLAQELGSDRLTFGVTYHSCSVVGLAEIAHTGRGETVVGPYEGDDLEPAYRVRELLASSGWDTTVSNGVRTEIWKKLILNSATLPTAALTGLAAGDLAGDSGMHELIDTIADEASAVATAFGLSIDPAERITRIHDVLRGAGQGKASMLQDALAHRKTEIEVINGAVVRVADELGIAVPVNRAMVALIGGLERSWPR